MNTFSELCLHPELLKALDSEGYTIPTPIQTQAIPSLIAGRDLLGIAQTGTGKTAAFALPILQRLAADLKPAPRNGARALILSPTRELASQIAESFRTYGKHLGFTVTTVFGGVGYRPQAQALQRGIDVLVATPGRLIDHMNERTAILSSTEILVLDEADQMMDLGFIRPLRQIISKLPARRQTMFFSATMPHEIGALAAELLRDPVKVAVTPVAKTADRVAQKVIFIEAQKKRSLLVELFSDPAMTRALVFTRTKRGADKVARHLETAGIAVAAIHGNKSQGQREAALAQFKASKIRALIATDIAARGIDVDLISHVVNYELPNIPESYVHRIGRTARAGAEGIAISLCDGEERAYLRDIERLTRQTIPSLDRRSDKSLAVPAEDRGGGSDRDFGDRRSQGGHRNSRAGGRDNAGHGGRFNRDSRGGERRASGNGGREDYRRDRSAERPSNGARADGFQHGRTASGARSGTPSANAPRQGESRSVFSKQGRDSRKNGGGNRSPSRDHSGGKALGDREPNRRSDDRRPAGKGSGNGELRNVAFLSGAGGEARTASKHGAERGEHRGAGRRRGSQPRSRDRQSPRQQAD